MVVEGLEAVNVDQDQARFLAPRARHFHGEDFVEVPPVGEPGQPVLPRQDLRLAIGLVRLSLRLGQP